MGFITTLLFPFVILIFLGAGVSVAGSKVPMSKDSSDASLSERERGDGRFLELADAAIEAEFEPIEEDEFILDLSRSMKPVPKPSSESSESSRLKTGVAFFTTAFFEREQMPSLLQELWREQRLRPSQAQEHS